MVAECDVSLAEDVTFDVVHIPNLVSSSGGRMVLSRRTLLDAICDNRVILVLVAWGVEKKKYRWIT